MNRQPDDPGPDTYDPDAGLCLLEWLLVAGLFVLGFAVGVAVTLMLTPAHASQTAEGQEREPCDHPELMCCIVVSGHPLCEYEGEK